MAQAISSSPVFDFYPSRGKTSLRSGRASLLFHKPLSSFSNVPFYWSRSVVYPVYGVGRGTVVPRAVTEEQTPSSTRDDDRAPDVSISPSAATKDVLVVGASGGVGQLVVASLLNRNIKLRLLVRDPEKVSLLFGRQDKDNMKILKADTRNPLDMDPVIFEGVTHVICCTGTTAFPSRRWDGDNSPEKIGREFGI